MEKNDILILNYDSEKRNFVLSSGVLGDVITQKREIKWDFENIIEEFRLDYMKFVVELLQKAQIKKNRNTNEIAELVRIAYNNCPKPNENQFKCNISFDEPKALKIDYYCMMSIGHLIMIILKYIIEKEGKGNFPQLLQMVIQENNFCRIGDEQIWGKSVIQFKNEFQKIEILSFDLSSPNTQDSYFLYYVILFYYFYNVFFPNVTQITLNLNVNRINNVYNIDQNPYKIRNEDIVFYCKKYENIFISNYILTCIISNCKLSAFRVIMSESYINEVNDIFSRQFEKSSFKELISKKNSLLYFRQLMEVKDLSKISISINCLDIFLFKEIINLIGIHSQLKRIELELFTEPKYMNLRKLYFNYLKEQEFQEIDPNIVKKYQIIMYPYIENLEEVVQPLIEEEKIPDLLFPEFKKHINTLKLILNQYVTTIQSFYLDISPYEEICKYDNYNIEILLFIFVVLSAFERPNVISSLELKCLNINYTSVLYIKKKINSLIGDKLIDLSKCKTLEFLNLKMSGISLFIDFNKLPSDNLTKLHLKISTLRDMKAINEALKNQKNNFLKLLEIKIYIGINASPEIFKEFLKIYENFPPNLGIFGVIIENIVNKKDLLKLIEACHRNLKYKNTKKVFYYLCCYSPELEIYLDNFEVKNLKTFFDKNNVYYVEKCRLNETRKITLTMINWPEKDILKAIILAFNKKINANEGKRIDNKKILSKIFNFMGKTHDFLLALNQY